MIISKTIEMSERATEIYQPSQMSDLDKVLMEQNLNVWFVMAVVAVVMGLSADPGKSNGGFT